jgi:Holliday junction resolvase RusA-like endonuclease
MHLTFWVDEAPAPEPRHRTRVIQGRDGHAFASTYTPARADRFKHAARAALVDAMRAAGGRSPLVSPEAGARVLVECVIPRPKSHLRADGTLTPRAPLYPTRRRVGDVDNFGKALLDSLGPWKGPALAWDDDSVVLELCVRKRYANPGEPPGCTVAITTPA